MVDYLPIGSSSSLKPFANPGSAGGGYNSLFNGNISAMSLNLPSVGLPLLYTYRYDQLNRLKKLYTYSGLNPATNSWKVSAVQDYRETITYDPNGNILTYKRNGDAARRNVSNTGMDNLSYHYKANTNQLDKVTDAAEDASAGEYE